MGSDVGDGLDEVEQAEQQVFLGVRANLQQVVSPSWP